MSDKKTLTLTQENFEREVLEAKQPVLVDFGADWCAPCRAIGPVVDELAAEFQARAIVGKVGTAGRPYPTLGSHRLPATSWRGWYRGPQAGPDLVAAGH